jgi:non-heme chloroperoxidase
MTVLTIHEQQEIDRANKQQEKNPGVTEIHEIPGRGHSLTIDHGWREVAEIALAFIAQQLKIG